MLCSVTNMLLCCLTPLSLRYVHVWGIGRLTICSTAQVMHDVFAGDHADTS